MPNLNLKIKDNSRYLRFLLLSSPESGVPFSPMRGVSLLLRFIMNATSLNPPTPGGIIQPASEIVTPNLPPYTQTQM
jgi:hypothetical protein